MAQITLQGNPINTVGTLPETGSKGPDFKLTKTDLNDVTLSDFTGKRLVLNIFPSIDTGACTVGIPCTQVWFREFGFEGGAEGNG